MFAESLSSPAPPIACIGVLYTLESTDYPYSACRWTLTMLFTFKGLQPETVIVAVHRIKQATEQQERCGSLHVIGQ